MKSVFLAAALVCGTALFATGPAQAAGCVKGAVVGGIAGHFLGNHGLLGATAGCLIGHHEANRHYYSRRYYGNAYR